MERDSNKDFVSFKCDFYFYSIYDSPLETSDPLPLPLPPPPLKSFNILGQPEEVNNPRLYL